ncbi:MAG: hypothetical protein DMF88_07825 [Acidobacteria bacterium]|nr:MAG: hypothetical protein DMF88_07825 [Acidobacteriota bacterium]
MVRLHVVRRAHLAPLIRTLQSTSEIEASRRSLQRRGLSSLGSAQLLPWQLLYAARFIARPLQVDAIKSWDVDSAIRLIERHVPDRDASILDMGCFNSEVVYALHAAGYRNVHGIDLNPRCEWMPYWHRIRYRTGDLTRSGYATGAFQAITCLSVVEHGVDVAALAAEARRLLTPGGILVVTTDFDVRGGHSGHAGLTPFGLHWRIFDPTSIRKLISVFASAGLGLLEGGREADLVHDSCPIQWNGERYTFLLLVFRAGAARVS